MKQSTDVANNYIPKNYDDLYRYYIHGDGNGNSLCHKIIRSILSHSTEDERETLAHDVFERVMKSNMLEKFDSDKANFGGVIFFVTRSIVVNHLDRKGRTPLTGLNGGSLVITDPDDEVFEPGVYNLERLFSADVPDTGDALDASKTVRILILWAKGLYDKPAHKRDASLYPLLGLLREGFNPKECGQELGVTPSTVHNWLLVLKAKVFELQSAH